MSISANATGRVGFLNQGYNGIPVNRDTYSSAFFMKGNYSGDVTVSLKGPSGSTYASNNVSVRSTGENFTYYELPLESAASPSGENVWQLDVPASEVAGSTLWFDLIQLYPTTYHSRFALLQDERRVLT